MLWFAIAMSTFIAAANPVVPPRIAVIGHGVVKTPPDVAILSFTVRGEGATSDAAARDLVRKQVAINLAVANQLGVADDSATGELTLREARDATCKTDDTPQLSSGSCAVRGYIAELPMTLRVAAVDAAGTVVGLAARAGATDVKVKEFGLQDFHVALRRAETAAIADARDKTTAAAAAAGVHLGSIISVEDANIQDLFVSSITVTAQRRSPTAPAVMVEPPVAITTRPEPIETNAQMVVTYAIAP